MTQIAVILFLFLIALAGDLSKSNSKMNLTAYSVLSENKTTLVNCVITTRDDFCDIQDINDPEVYTGAIDLIYQFNNLYQFETIRIAEITQLLRLIQKNEFLLDLPPPSLSA